MIRETLCAALAPGQVRFDIETHDPPLVVHRSFGREEACLLAAAWPCHGVLLG